MHRIPGKAISENTGTSVWAQESEIQEDGHRLTEVHIRQLNPQRETVVVVDEDGDVRFLQRFTS